MDGQAPPSLAVAPESLLPSGQASSPVAVAPESPSPPLVAEDDSVVVPDTVELASSEACKAGAFIAVPPRPTSLLEAEEDPVVVPDTVEAASSEATKVGAGGVPPSPPLGAEDDHLVVPSTVVDTSLEISEGVAPVVVLTDELRDKIVKQVRRSGRRLIFVSRKNAESRVPPLVGTFIYRECQCPQASCNPAFVQTQTVF
jgi:hypothetical protein